jgi:hypothetical protein
VASRRTSLDPVEDGPVVPPGCPGLDDDSALATGSDFVRGSAADPPGVAGTELARLVADPIGERARYANADLLVLVAVLGHATRGVELDHRHRHPLAPRTRPRRPSQT